MMSVLDNDGDGEVTKEEFKDWYQQHITVKGAKVSDADFEKLWLLIDANGDGILQQSELCTYFRVSFEATKEESNSRKNMTDDDVLAALALQTQLYEAKQAMLAAEAEKKKKSLTRRTASGAREGVTVIKKTDATGEKEAEFKFLEACDLIMKEDRETIVAYLDKGRNLRIESQEKAEMPYHKLARNGEVALIKQIFKTMDSLVTRDIDKNTAHLLAVADINSQDKRGYTPIFCAAEGNQAMLTKIKDKPEELLKYRETQANTCKELLLAGADLYVEANTGWNLMHVLAHSSNLEAAKEIITFMEGRRYTNVQFRRFLNHKDNMGRTPLHIAAMRDTDNEKPDFAALLIKRGADPSITDQPGNTASAVAGLAGRRKSKEYLENVEEEKKIAQQSYRRRSRSRDLELPPHVLAAATAPPA